MTGRMLCSGTAGPRKRGSGNYWECPVCRKSWWKIRGTKIPRHFIITPGGAS